MQFMSSWATGDRRTLLHFTDSTLETFSSIFRLLIPPVKLVEFYLVRFMGLT